VGPRSYLKLECIGKGGSSRVYRVLGEDLCSYALKRVRLSRMDAASVASYSNEIALLRRLAGRKHIIRLLDAEVNYASRCIHMVMEHGQMDLNKLVQTERERVAAAAAASGAAGAGAGSAVTAAPGICMDGNLLRVVWQQMLIAVQTIHEARIVHGDLKPANFVFVEGTLKLIDFGIARAISSDTTHIVREGTVGTLNYMSPEAIQDVSAAPGAGGAPSLKLGRASDIWSLGCILYQMAYGRTPFAELPLIAKLHAIVDPGYVIPFPPCSDAALLQVMRACLQRTPSQRPTIAGAGGLLSHPLLNPQVPLAAARPAGSGSADRAGRAEAAVQTPAAAGGVAGGDSLSAAAVLELVAALLPACAGAAERSAEVAHKLLRLVQDSGAAAAAEAGGASVSLRSRVGTLLAEQGLSGSAAAAPPPAAAAGRPLAATAGAGRMPGGLLAALNRGPAAVGASPAKGACAGVVGEGPRPSPSRLRSVASARDGAGVALPRSRSQPHAQPLGLLLGQAEILERRAALRPVAPARAGEPADKENGGGAGSGKPHGVVRGRLPFGGPGAGNGLEAALRRGLSERFGHVAAAPSASARARGAAGGGAVDTSVTMDLDTTATWVS
jgi:hypothetical protein